MKKQIRIVAVDDNEAVLKNVYASKYLTYMPSKEELLNVINDEKELLELSKDEFENK